MNVKKEMISTFLVLVVGFLSHFLYEWSNPNVLVGILCPVNESIWEHLKLIYYPMLIPFFFHFNKKYFQARISEILISILFLLVSFYTYSGIIGQNFAVINILLYITTILLGQFLISIFYQNEIFFPFSLSLLFFFLLFFSFTLFTFYPPKLSVFQDPISCTYGILQYRK